MPYDPDLEAEVLDLAIAFPEEARGWGLEASAAFAYAPHAARFQAVLDADDAPPTGVANAGDARDRRRRASQARQLASLAQHRSIDGAVPLKCEPAELPAVVRVPGPVTRRRLLLGCTIGAAWGAWVSVVDMATGTASGPAVLALLVLLAASLVAVFVDLDTLYLDQPVFLTGVATSTGLAAVAALSARGPREIGFQLLVSYGLALFLFIFSVLYGRLRGLGVPLGFGDIVVMAAALSVTSLITGTITVGLVGLMSGIVLQVVVSLVVLLRKRASLRQHVAAIPCLIAGTALAWPVLQVLGHAGQPLVDFLNQITGVAP